MKLDQRTALMLAAGAGLAYLLILSARAAKSTAQSAVQYAGESLSSLGNAINPVNQDNIFYGGVNAVGGKLTGDSDFTLGGWIYDKTH